MKIRNSLKTAKTRDKNCVVVRRRGRVYVINKKNPRLRRLPIGQARIYACLI